MPGLVIPDPAPEWGGPLRQLERVILDPITEDTANAPLELSGRDGGHGIYLVSHTYTPGDRKRNWAGNLDSIGEQAVGEGIPSNRQIPYTVYVAEEQSIGSSENRVPNPKAAVDLTDWVGAGTGPAVISRLAFTTRSPLGIAIPYPNGVSAETGIYFQGSQGNDRAYVPWGSTAGRTYTGSAWVWIDSLGGATGFRVDLRDPSGVIVASSDVYSVVRAWARLSCGYQVPTSDNYRISLTQVGDGATVAAATAFFVENSQSVNPYFDGDTPGCFWTGARHSSPATRRADGGKRFNGALHDLEQKLEKFASEGGTIKRVLPDQDELIFDVVDANGLGDWDKPFNQHRAQQTFTITAKPYARGYEVTLDDHAETALPVVIGTDTIEQGSTRSIGRLVVDDDAGKSRLYVVWGAQSRYYDPDPEAALFFQAEDRSAQNGAVAGALAGASGGQAVKQTSLTRTWASVLSTVNPSTFFDHKHVGAYRFIARCYLPAGNSGRVGVKLQWSVDDFQTWTTNDDDAVIFKAGDSRQGGFVLADLGIVSLDEEPDQTGRWRGRILGKSTVLGDGLYIDCYALIPCEISGELNVGEPEVEVPSSFFSRDEFNQANGNLDTKALPVGGAWHEGAISPGSDGGPWQIVNAWPSMAVRAGSADDPNETSGRYLVDNASSHANLCVQADVTANRDNNSIGSRLGVIARYTDTANWLFFGLRAIGNADDGPVELRVYKCVAGTIKLLESGFALSSFKALDNNWHTLRLYVDAAGRYYAWSGLGGIALGASSTYDPADATAQTLDLVYSGQDADLATGGALATGETGFYGAQGTADMSYLAVANYFAFAPANDAAIFANRSLEIRSDVARRLNASGLRWATKAEYEGDYCILPPAGREQRTLRTIVLASEGEPLAGSDPAIDDTSFRLHLTPQFDVVPEPTT